MNSGRSTTALVVGVVTITIPTLILFRAVTFLCFVPLVLGSISILLGCVSFRTDSPIKNYVGWIAFVNLAVAILLPFGMIAYHDRQGYPLVMVISNGYRGPVKLILDRNDGIEVPLENGTYIYRIPASGVLTIKDDSPFRQWHSMRIWYDKGPRIRDANIEITSPDEVALYSLGSYGGSTGNGKSGESMQWFLGTHAEKLQYVASQ